MKLSLVGKIVSVSGQANEAQIHVGGQELTVPVAPDMKSKLIARLGQKGRNAWCELSIDVAGLEVTK